MADERRTHPRRHVPVDPPHVVSRPVGLMLVEVEAGTAQRALVGADALIADLAGGRHLDVAQLAHDVLWDHLLPRGFARRTPLHALSLTAAPARAVRVARSLRSLAPKRAFAPRTPLHAL